MVQFEGIAEPVVGGIAIFGSAAAYGLVWEYGAPPPWHIKKPGPKTVYGSNPTGKGGDIFSSQAPAGYIAIHEEEFWPIIEEEMATVQFKSSTADGIRLELEIAMDNASQRIARIVSDSAPADSGDLRSQIQYVDSSGDDSFFG